MLAAAAAGASEGEWLRAVTQTGGRGRLGRVWQSPPGNLYASTIVGLRANDPPASTLGFVAAVALEEVASVYLSPSPRRRPGPLGGSAPDSPTGPGRCLSSGSPGARPGGRGDVLTLKWPNDLLLGDAKLAGILLERTIDAVVIGFGLNLAHHPQDLDRPTASLPGAPDPALFLEDLTAAFARWLGIWRGQAFAAIRARWLACAHPIGTALTTSEGIGLFEGLNADGALRLRLADGSTRVIHAGDVFVI